MQRGWSAKGLLRPLWQNYPGKRDGLAAAVGTDGGTLSGVNTGRLNLGLSLGRRLAAELGVTLAEIGAPPDVDEEARSLVARLESLAEEAERGRRAVIAALEAIDDRLERIEERLGIPASRARPR